MKYRADIDGLRAVAILFVLFYHAFPGSIRGGFVGVDVFFVISGYLITSIILQQSEQGRFSLIDFYCRRICRIFPALLLVLIFCLVFGWFALFADEYLQLSQHVLGGAGFYANFLNWSEIGYFDHSSKTKPLLHLWSLSIEEQFYVLFPICLLLMRTFKVLPILLLLTALSFGINLNFAYVNQDTVGDFYSPLSRCWELLVGSVIAYLAVTVGFDKAKDKHWLSWLGMGMIVLAAFILGKHVHFPGLWALLPVMGTALLIIAGKNSFINRTVLSHPVMVGIGLISYPLYLWHYALFGYLRTIQGEDLPAFLLWLALLLSFVLSFATLRWIESYFRNGIAYRRKSIMLLLVMACVAGVALFIVMHKGFGERDNIGLYAQAITEMNVHEDSNAACLSKFGPKDITHYLWYFCQLTNADKPIEVIILGDSFANALIPGLKAQPEFEKTSILHVGNCNSVYMDPNTPDLLAIGVKHPCYKENYYETKKLISNIIRTTPSLKLAFISISTTSFAPEFNGMMLTKIKELNDSGINVVLLLAHQRVQYNPKLCLQRPFSIATKSCVMDDAVAQHVQKDAVQLRAGIAQLKLHAMVFNNNDVFCKHGECRYLKNGIPVFKDAAGHLTATGSGLVAQEMLRQLKAEHPEYLKFTEKRVRQ